MCSASALFVMTVGLHEFSNHTSVCIGGTLTFLGYILTAFIEDIRLFYLAQGVLAGTCLSLPPEVLGYRVLPPF